MESKNGNAEISKDPRLRHLLEFGTQIRPRELFPGLHEQAALIEENPFAFALAAVLNRGTKADIIWTIHYYLQSRIGELNPRFFVNKPIENLEKIFRELPSKPRYIADAPRTVKGLSKMVLEEYNGDVTNIWRNKTSSYVKATFQRIYGVGPNIAWMVVLLLERCFGVQFTDIDHRSMDIKPDVHIVHVFHRIGFISELNENEALKAARRLNPEYPGALDSPTWIIGKNGVLRLHLNVKAAPLMKSVRRRYNHL